MELNETQQLIVEYLRTKDDPEQFTSPTEIALNIFGVSRPNRSQLSESLEEQLTTDSHVVDDAMKVQRKVFREAFTLSLEQIAKLSEMGLLERHLFGGCRLIGACSLTESSAAFPRLVAVDQWLSH
jgi:hypothetical protein